MSGGISVDAPSALRTERASIRFRLVREDDPEGADSSELRAVLADYEAARFGRAAPAQLRFNTASVRMLLGWAGPPAADGLGGLAAVQVETLEDWLAALARGGASAKTCRNRLAGVGAVLTWARKRRMIRENPARDVEAPAVEDPPHAYLCEADRERAVCLAAAAGIECEVVLSLYAGLRMSELQRLRWADVCLADRCLVVLKAKGRSGKTKWRRVSLHARALEALRRQRERALSVSPPFPSELRTRNSELPSWVFPGGRARKDGRPGAGTWSRNQPRGREKWLSLLAPLQAAIPAFATVPKGACGRGWHMLRHTFGSLALQHGIAMAHVSKMLGHSSIVTTERHYAWLRDGYDPEIEKL